MEVLIRDLTTNLGEMASALSRLSERVNKLCDTSSCQGDLCSCITFYKGVEAQMKDVFRLMKQKEHEDKMRDKKLDQLTKDIANKCAAENVTNSPRADPKTNSRQERTNLEQQRKTSAFSKKSFRPDDKNDSKRLGERREGSLVKQRSADVNSSYDNSSDNEYESPETKVNTEVQAKTKETPEQQRRLNPHQGHRYVSKFPIPKKDNPSHGKISKPNFKQSTEVALRQPSASAIVTSTDQTQVNDDLPVVVEQKEKEYFLSAGVWNLEARAEEASSQKTALRKLEAITTILLIDTSQSMAAGDTWHQVKMFVNDYIDGLEEMSTKHGGMEHVALVTFGAQTRCLQRYTNDFSLIRSAFNKLHLGGPSPLFGGLTMADSVALTCEKDIFMLENGMLVYTKIILITDGEPTEVCLHRGPDIADPEKMEETMAMLMSLMEVISSRPLDLFCVPVGNRNKEILNLLFVKEGGRRFLNYRDGNYFSRRLFLTMKFEVRRNLFFGLKYEIPRQDPELTARDFAHMQEILDDNHAKNSEERKRKEENPYEERNNSRLVPVGSRVRRGPDWRNGIEDGEGPGTVVGHNLYCDRLWVYWDKTEEVHQYSYGEMDLYAVFPVDEPRILLPGQPLDVGCLVTTGKDWKEGVVPAGSKGVIIRMGSLDGIRKAGVRWENGKRGFYSYGDDKIYEVIMCIPGSTVPAVSSQQTVQTIEYHRQSPTTQPAVPSVTSRNRNAVRQNESQTKNKNKNVN